MLLAWHGLQAAPILVRGDDGVQLSLPHPAQRIISLAPHLTEIVYAAGAGEKLIGVSAYSDYPEAATKLPQVGDASNLDLERIVALKPDLILAWKSNVSPFAVQRLRRMNIPVHVSETRRLTGISQLLRQVGNLSGSAGVADQSAQQFERGIREFASRANGKAIVPTFIEIWHDPLLSVNGEHLMSEVVSLCGGKNILEEMPTLTPSIGLETLLEANPGAIIGGGSAATADAFRTSWRTHVQLRAVQREAIFYVNPDQIQRATPRILSGVKDVCDALDLSRR